MSETKFNFKVGDKISVKPDTIRYLSGKNLTLTGKERVDGRDMWKATDGQTVYLLFEDQIILMEEEKKEMFKPYTHTTTTSKTVKDIYGTSTPSIPEGWEAIDFRPALFKEKFLTEFNAVFEASYDHTKGSPRIILRKLEPISDKELLDCLIGWLWSNAPGHVADSFLTNDKVFRGREEFDKAVLTRATELARKKKANAKG